MIMQLIIAALFLVQANATQPDKKTLPIGLAPHEQVLVQRDEAPMTSPPEGHIHSLSEWEEAEAVMMLWTNASYIRELTARGKVKLFADSRNDQSWWQNFLEQNGISEDNVSYFNYPTDSIWIRDYSPWFILDGKGQMGIVDTKYNRPRPLDDVIPIHLSKELGLPLFQPGLVHTGGNYYNDGVQKAFSSTLVYKENRNIDQTEVNHRMLAYLGIENYVTSPLGESVTIEHLDTFGKLVAPDTFVFSDFPNNQKNFKRDADLMVEKIKSGISAYGTPYKIFRMPMVLRPGSSGTDYRAYLNSFISNGVLYFPTYGDSKDEVAKSIYQKALPGYEIVGVPAPDTEWGDSIHCRSRNLLKRNTLFIFPKVENKWIKAEIIPSPGAEIKGKPEIFLSSPGKESMKIEMEPVELNQYQAKLPAFDKGTVISFSVSASDTSGVTKQVPRQAPKMMIDYTYHD